MNKNNVVQLRQHMLQRAKALGNSGRGLKEVASDLLNQYDRKHLDDVAEGTFLCKATLQRVMDCDPDYRPQADTLERIFRFCNAEIRFDEVRILPRNRNQPKE